MSSKSQVEIDLVDSLEDDSIAKNLEESDDKSARKSNNGRLQDIETQLEMAESRCNNLKDQLDYMKQMYGVSRNASAKSRKVSSIKSPFKISTATLEEVVVSKEDNSANLPSNRQQSTHIGTDNTGAAVRTINNILNGITNSVNRLSEIHSQLATPRVKVSTGVSAQDQTVEKKSVGIVPELKFDSSSNLTQKLRGQKRKAVKTIKTSSQLTIKKAGRVEKKTKSVVARSNARLENNKSTNRIFKKFQPKNVNNLVEIYHNDAVKHSDSDESNLKKSRQQAEDDDKVPPLNISHRSQDLRDAIRSEFAYPTRNNFPYEPLEAPRTTVSCCYNKNYELPTVASRMKQVAKSYMGTLNMKTIPFCAAISTTQSHNIGINIQQVMNIIKNRQPINGISPTLVHNIGLAAEKLHNKPFSALVSSINSKISQTVSKCPLSRTYLDFRLLQEQAKTIPEENIEELEEENADSPKVQTMIITGPSGDMEIKTKNTPTWKIDKNTPVEQCTCIVQQPNVGFQQMANRYQRNIRTITENSLNSQIMENQIKKRLKKYKTLKTVYTQKAVVSQENQVQTVQQEPQKDETLKGREKNLKEVLANLHQDFDSLNKRYEDLSQKSQTDGDENSVKELERLELELTKKEEEITMVMALYKEVLALKQQVKQLKEKRSQASIPSKDQKDTKIKFKEYNNPEAAFHLTKLLKQIQHYQMRYKSNLSQE